MLSLRHLMILKTVAETGNFTRAAGRLYITQSAVSHAVRELERDTGMVLFDRQARQVRLTAGGRRLLDEALPILAACESLEQRIGQLEERAPVQIVSSITIAAFWLPGILKQMKQNMPDTPFYVNVVSAAAAMETLRAGEADIALVEGALPEGPFHWRHLSEYRLQAVCAPDDPAAGTCLTIPEFCGADLLLREAGSAIRDTLDSVLFLAGHVARPAWVSVNSTALLEAARAGLGITVLPEVLVKEELARGGLAAVEVAGLALKNEMIAVWYKDKHITPALQALLSYGSLNDIGGGEDV